MHGDEVEAGRSPIQGTLIVAVNTGRTRDVLAIFKERRKVHGVPAELKSEGPEKSLREPVEPVDVGGEPKAIGGVQESEDVGISLPRVLKCKVAVELILAIDAFVPTGIQAVLMSVADQRHLIVVSAGTREVRERIKVQQRLGLRADAARRNDVARKRRAGERIDNRGDDRRKVAHALRRRWHQRSPKGVVPVARPGIVDKEVGTILEQVRNFQRAAEVSGPGEMVITGLGSILACYRKSARVPDGIIHEKAQAAVVERSRSVAVVAEGREQGEGRTGSVIHAAVDQQAIFGALRHFVARRFCFADGRLGRRLLWLAWRGRCRLRRGWGRRGRLSYGVDLV